MTGRSVPTSIRRTSIRNGLLGARAGLARERSGRGVSLTVFAVVIMAALIMTAGLVIDGGQKASAVSRAESVAAAAARAGAEAGATDSVAGRSDTGKALAAADAYLAASSGVRGSASVTDGQLSVHTEVSVQTIVLSVIGYDHLTGTGDATAQLYGTGER